VAVQAGGIGDDGADESEAKTSAQRTKTSKRRVAIDHAFKALSAPPLPA